MAPGHEYDQGRPEKRTRLQVRPEFHNLGSGYEVTSRPDGAPMPVAGRFTPIELIEAPPEGKSVSLMSRRIHELSDQEKRQTTDELMIHTGPFGALLAAAVLMLVVLWNPGLIKTGLSNSAATSALHHRQWVNFALERRSSRRLLLGSGDDRPQESNREQTDGRKAQVPARSVSMATPAAPGAEQPAVRGESRERVYIAREKRKHVWTAMRTGPEYSARLGYNAEAPPIFRSW